MKSFDELPDRARKLLVNYYGYGMKPRDISAEMKLSTERIRQIRFNAVKSLGLDPSKKGRSAVQELLRLRYAGNKDSLEDVWQTP